MMDNLIQFSLYVCVCVCVFFFFYRNDIGYHSCEKVFFKSNFDIIVCITIEFKGFSVYDHYIRSACFIFNSYIKELWGGSYRFD